MTEFKDHNMMISDIVMQTEIKSYPMGHMAIAKLYYNNDKMEGNYVKLSIPTVAIYNDEGWTLPKPENVNYTLKIDIVLSCMDEPITLMKFMNKDWIPIAFNVKDRRIMYKTFTDFENRLQENKYNIASWLSNESHYNNTLIEIWDNVIKSNNTPAILFMTNFFQMNMTTVFMDSYNKFVDQYMEKALNSNYSDKCSDIIETMIKKVYTEDWFKENLTSMMLGNLDHMIVLIPKFNKNNFSFNPYQWMPMGQNIKSFGGEYKYELNNIAHYLHDKGLRIDDKHWEYIIPGQMNLFD